MINLPQRQNQPMFDLSGLGSKMPDNLPGSVPTVPDGTGGTPPAAAGDVLTPAEKLALAEKEIATRNAGGTSPAEGAVEETEEQIQAKLDTLATKEEKDLTPEDKAYIAKYVPEEVSPVDSARSFMVEKYGATDIAEKKYDNTPEGLSAIVDDVAPVVAEKMLLDYFAQIPYMKEFYEHVSEGRGLETFLAKNQKPAFELIDIKQVPDDASETIIKQSKDNQRQMIRMDLASKGVDTETIESIIDLADGAGKLFEKANTAKAQLKARHQAAVEAAMKEEELAIQQEEAQKQAVYKQVEQMFEKNDFGGLSLPVADLKAFRDATTRVDGQGNTVMHYKRSKLTTAQRVFLDYIVWKDFKGIGTPKAAQTSKAFTFKQAGKQNDVRNGGRVRDASANLNLDVKGSLPFLKINQT